MKTLTFFLISMLCFSIAVFAEATTSANVQEFTISTIGNALMDIISSLNLKFIIVFMLATWLVNDSADATNVATGLNWLSKISTTIRTLIIAFLLIVLFAWAFKITKRLDIFNLFISVLVAMGLYKLGPKQILRWISVTILKFKFE